MRDSYGRFTKEKIEKIPKEHCGSEGKKINELIDHIEILKEKIKIIDSFYDIVIEKIIEKVDDTIPTFSQSSTNQEDLRKKISYIVEMARVKTNDEITNLILLLIENKNI